MSGQVPKFGSFKPKKELDDKTSLGDSGTINVDQPSLKVSLNDKEKDGRSKRKKDDYLEKDSHRRHRHHHRHQSHSKERGSDMQVELRTTTKSDDHLPLGGDSHGLFIIDKQGDEKNLVYGSIHRYSVPSFRRYGKGFVLGCPKDVKIDRDLSDDTGIVLRDCRNTHPSKREKYAFAKVEKKAARLLKVRPEAKKHEFEIGADFVSFSSSRKKIKRADIDEGFISEDDHQHYRSIEGKAKDGLDPFDQDFEYETDASSSDLENGRKLSLDTAIKTENVELSRNVEKYPQNVDAWIKLINHQDKLLGIGENGPRKITQAERKSTAEIKIHMYEKALRRVDSLSTKSLERLSIGLMDEGAKVWDTKIQASRWESITKEYPYSVILWKKYVDFKQTNFSTFGYEEQRILFSSRISLLRNLILEGNRSKSEMNELYQSIIYTLIRATVFIRDSGFRELALGIWQGLLEFNFSSSSNTVASELVEVFRDFWESEVPRIGEEGSLGWSAFVKNPASSSAPDPRSDAELPLFTSLEGNKAMFEKWATAENHQSKDSREPARTMDDVTENDPYRLILFSDIEPFLIRLPIDNDIDLGRLLFNAFLAFCQLPQIPIPGSYFSSKVWREDSFIRTELFDCERNQLQSLEADHDDILEIFSCYAFQNFASSSDTMFAGNDWFKCLKPWTQMYSDDSSPIRYQWIRNTLEALSTKSLHFAEYYLAFDFVNEPKTIKKTAKNLLKRYPTSLELYNAYAKIEWIRGNKDIASNVFSSALGMASSVSDSERNNTFLLRKSLVWALLEDRNPTESFQHLLGVPNSIASPAAILKTKHEFLAARDYSVSSGQVSMAIIQTELLAMLEYYTPSLGTQIQGDIVSALSIFTKFSETLSVRGVEENNDIEILHQSAARLLYFDAKLGPYRPAFLRENLMHSLTIFPQNTILLSLFAWNERRLAIDKKVRSVLLNTVLTPGTAISHIFAIRQEILHGNVHSQRAAFENAVSGDSDTKSNAGVWKLYLLWCLQTEKFESKAKDVFYRGVAACPWAKGLMMLAFGELSDFMRGDDMKGIYKVLVEKELRVHVDIDELMEV